MRKGHRQCLTIDVSVAAGERLRQTASEVHTYRHTLSRPDPLPGSYRTIINCNNWEVSSPYLTLFLVSSKVGVNSLPMRYSSQVVLYLVPEAGCGRCAS